MRLPRATFWEIDSLSAWAKALSTVRIISEFMVAVLMFSFSKYHRDSHLLQHSDILDTVQCVAGEAGD